MESPPCFLAITTDSYGGSGGHRHVIHPLDGTVHRLSLDAIDVLECCVTARDPSDLDQQLRSRGWETTRELPGILSDLRARRLLWSESDLKRAFGAGVPSKNPIPVLGIISRDRPEALARCLTSYLDTRPEGDVQRVIVCDQSSRPDLAPELFSRCGAMGIELVHLDRARQDRFIDELKQSAQVAGLDPQTAEFALGYDGILGYRPGANRNLLQLMTLGETVISADDDTTAVGVTADSGHLMLTSDPGLGETAPFAANTDLPEADPQTQIIQRHRALLGSAPAEFVGRLVADGWTGARSPLLRALLDPDGRVRVTMAGLLGDSGMGLPAAMLALTGAARVRLVGNESTQEAYRLRLLSRNVLRLPKGNIVSDATVLSASNFGFDNRELLPPFPPAGRNAEGVFAALTGALIPGTLFARLGAAVEHRPIEARSFASKQLWNTGVRLSEILLMVINGGTWFGRSSDERMRQCGLLLQYIAGLSDGDFRDYLAERYLIARAEYVELLEGLLRRHAFEPTFWAEDVQKRIEAVEAIAMERMGCAAEFAELPPGAARTATRDFVARFGRLVAAWPAMRSAAQTLQGLLA